VAAGLYVGFAAAKIAAHQMWRDEWQSWLLARSSHSIGQLISRVRYEQHPPGWYLLLWVLSRLTASPVALQVLMVGLVATLTAVVLWLAPFAAWIKWLILFGYFPFFEYSTLGRPYILDLILTLVAAELIRRNNTGMAFAVTLSGLVFFDNAYGSVLAVALLAAAWLRAGALPVGDRSRARRRMMGVTTGIVLVELGLLALERVPTDYGGTLQLSQLAHPFSLTGQSALEQPLNALVPLPQLQLHFWNTHLIDQLPTGMVIILGLGAVLGLAWLLRRDPAALALWLIGAIGTVAGMDVAIQNTSRFAGTIYIALLAAFWISDSTRQSNPSAVRVAIAITVILQVPGGIVANAIAATHPFSQAESAASAIRHLPGTIIAAPDYAAAPVAGYANRPLYLAQSRRYGTYTIWNTWQLCHGQSCTDNDLQQQALRATARIATQGPTYVILNFAATPASSLHLCHAYTGAIEQDENYWLYAVNSTPCNP